MDDTDPGACRYQMRHRFGVSDRAIAFEVSGGGNERDIPDLKVDGPPAPVLVGHHKIVLDVESGHTSAKIRKRLTAKHRCTRRINASEGTLHVADERRVTHSQVLRNDE